MWRRRTSHELMYGVMKTWCWVGGERKVGESSSHPQSHSPSAQTTTADIRRNKDHVFNDASMSLTQRQLDFYVRRERNLALVCGSAVSCIFTKNSFFQRVQQIQSHRFSTVFDTRPVRTLAGPPAVLRWFPSDAPRKAGHDRSIPHYHHIKS